jgi:hypothetical protein
MRTSLAAFWALAALLFTRGAFSQTELDPDSLEAELEAAAALDAQAAPTDPGTLPSSPVPTGRELLGNESNPSISLILDVVGAFFEEPRRVRLGGHAPSSSGFSVTGAEFAASANVDPYFRFDLFFCFAHMHLEEVVATTLALPGNLQARAGLFLSRVGRHNNTHPHSWHFVLHPLANQYLFGAEGLGAPGVELSWLVPLPWYVELIGAVQMGEGGAFRTQAMSDGDPSFEDFLYPVRLVQFFELSDDWALQIGGNTVLGPSVIGPEVGNRAYAYGGDLLLKFRPIGPGQTGHFFATLLFEAWWRDMEVPGDVWRDAGGYGDIILGLSKRLEVAARGELWRRVSGQAPSVLNGRERFGLDANRMSGVVSFFPSHFSRLRAQYTYEIIEGYYNNHIALVQLEVSAGAHGAHAY